MKCPSESTESLTSRLKVFIFSSVYLTINPGTSSVEASRSCLVELSLAILWVVYTGFQAFLLSQAKEVLYASPRTCSSFQIREEPLAQFERRFCLLLALQRETMVLKTL